MKPHAETTPKWNIIFLIYAEIVDTTTVSDATTEIDDVERELRKLENDILSVETSDTFNLFTIKNILEVKENYVVSDTTTVSNLTTDSTGTRSIKSLKTLYIEDFIQKGEEIRNIFQYIDQNYPADKTLLITWDHGSVFGIFKKTLRDKIGGLSFSGKYSIVGHERIEGNYATNEAGLLCLVKNKKLTYHPELKLKTEVTVTSNKETLVDILTNDELADAITYGFKTKHVDVLIMFNCNMQNMHTCYSFRNTVKYLVAPQDAIATPGYDYASIINLIGQNTDLEVDSATIASYAIDTLQQHFYNDGNLNKLNHYAIFAVCLTDYEQKIIPCMRLLAEKLMAMCQNEKVMYQIANERSKCYTYGIDFNYDMVDFINFLLKLNIEINDPELKLLTRYFESSYNSIIIAKKVGNNIYTNGGVCWEQAENILPKGVTVYFPTTAPDELDAVVINYMKPDSKFSTSLTQAIGWMEVLKKIFPDDIG